MESENFIRKIADALLDCITEHPEGGIWSVWHIEVDGRLFTAHIDTEVDYIPETGVEFMGARERWQRPVPKRVARLEVYETDALFDELDEALWDAPGNSDRIKTIINNRLYADSF